MCIINSFGEEIDIKSCKNTKYLIKPVGRVAQSV